jgi:hypothetical protein
MGFCKFVISIDVESDWESPETKGITEEIPKLLDFFDEHGIAATFFFVGKFVLQFHNLVKEISKNHEIASHGFNHKRLTRISSQEREHEIGHSKRVIEDLGIPCFGFRSPFYMAPPDLGSLLLKHGYSYDSSICGFINPGRFNHLGTPRTPYIADGNNIFSHGEGIQEFPISHLSLLSIPYSLQYIRLFYPVSLLVLSSDSYSLQLHTYDFIESRPGKEINLFLRPLYAHNRGAIAWRLLHHIVSRNKDKDFITYRQLLDSYTSNTAVLPGNCS